MNNFNEENAMNPSTVNMAALVGRILLAAIFVISGFNKIGGFSGVAGYIGSKGLPMPLNRSSKAAWRSGRSLASSCSESRASATSPSS